MAAEKMNFALRSWYATLRTRGPELAQPPLPELQHQTFTCRPIALSYTRTFARITRSHDLCPPDCLGPLHPSSCRSRCRSPMPAPTHLPPSDLGQKSYWDSAYTTERDNFAANADDEGTVWFSDAGAEERMLAFLEQLSDEGILRKEPANGGEDEAARFLDLGTGNGHLLFALREDAWCGAMVGVDYSAQSVRLAEAIRDTKGEGYGDIALHEWDILSQAPGAWLGGGFDVVLDKGTFDAVCLSQDTDTEGRRVCEGYRDRVEPLVKPGGRFLITSCNWTEEELRAWFQGGRFSFVGKVQYPSFTFGGKTGSSVVTLCFQKTR